MNRIIHRGTLWLVAAAVVVSVGRAVPAAWADSAYKPDKQVYRVSVAERADGKGYVIRLHTRGKVRSRDLSVTQDDLRYAEIVLANCGLEKDYERGEVAGPIKGLTLEQIGADVLLRLSLDPDRPVMIVAYPDRDSDDGLVALTFAEVERRLASAAPPEPSSPASSGPKVVNASVQSGPQAELSNPPASDPTPADGEAWRLDCVVIDPGHGGKDVGASANGVREKDVNLAVAKKLGYYIEDRLGMRVIYTRSDDRFVELHERGRIANEECGKLFISLHVNSARRRSANGTEIYFLGLHKTDAALDVMERENSVIRLESNPDDYVDLDNQQAILETLAQSVYLRESEHLAGLVHDQFHDRALRPTRGVKQAGFLVLWKASMPAVLVELGFLTNREEARYLKSARGHDLLASAIFRAVRSYRDSYQRGLDWEQASE